MLSRSTIIFFALVLAVYLGRKAYLMPKYSTSDEIPAFDATLLSGEAFQLKDLKGSYVLLHFWGSWCGPCRKENHELVQLYHKMKKEGSNIFQIVSIGIETGRESWLAAIEKDGLIWPYHVGTFQRFRSPIAKQFGVREIPTTYLLGPDGRILLVNGKPDEIADEIRDHLASN